jgi:AAA domain
VTAAEQLDHQPGMADFLGALFDGVDDGWVSTFGANRVTGDRQVNWRPVHEASQLAIDLQPAIPTSCLWVGAAVRGRKIDGARRGGVDDCTHITALWLDIDIAGPGHKISSLPPDMDAARQLLGDYQMPPSIIVNSGGGLQPWWLLSEPLEVSKATTLLSEWHATWTVIAGRRGWHLDNVFDVARVMRLPGTFNNKPDNPRPIPVVITDWHPNRRFGPDDFEQWMLTPAPTAEPRRERVTYVGPVRPGDAFNASFDVRQLWEAHGFHSPRVDHYGNTHYKAPHRNERGDTTGLTIYADDGHSTLWSEKFGSDNGIPTKRPLDPFGVYAFIEHRGNFANATNELSRRGYGTPVPDLQGLMVAARQHAADATETPLEGADSDQDDDWAPIDLATLAADIRAGNIQPTLPTVLQVVGALPLFYPARINSLFGASGGGKTWVALAAIAETVRNGERALMIDYEDHAQGITERLIILGLTDEQIALVDYRNPASGLSLGVRTICDTYTLVVLDSTGEAMAAGGVDSNADREVAQWFAIVKQLVRLESAPAVVILDHIPKDKDAPSGYAIGSQRKLAAITGAAYRVDTLKEPAKGKDGKLKLTVAKDRPGNRAKNTVAAEIDLIETAPGELSIAAHPTEAQTALAHGEKFRPTVLMERVSAYLAGVSRPVSGKNIEDNVSGKATGIRAAIEALVEDGYAARTPAGVEHVRNYFGPVDNSTSSPRPYLVPTSSQDEPNGGRPPRPRESMNGDEGRPPGGQDEANMPPASSPVDNSSRPLPDPFELF